MKRVVIDTNVLINWYKKGSITDISGLAAISPIFSIITQIEALGFRGITNKETAVINSMLATGELVYIDSEITKQTIMLRQEVKIKTPDAIIAATALINKAELWTANTSDFLNIKGLRLYNPIR